jgi:DNA-binding MarR family transcriptional regulator
MTDEKKPIRRWGEAPRATGTMRDLRSLRPPDVEATRENPPVPPPADTPEVPAPVALMAIPDPPAPVALVAPLVEAPPPPSGAPQTKRQIARPIEGPKSSLRKPTLNRPQLAMGPFDEFKARWKPFLRKGQLKICEVLYQKTHAVGQSYCSTSFSELSALSGLKIRQCFNIISQLEQMGLVERSRTASGSNKANAGSTLRFHLTPKEQ